MFGEMILSVSTFSATRVLVALAVGCIGCLFIWFAAPYNNFFLNNSFISDTFFPVSGVVFMLVIVLIVNPILHLIRKGLSLNRRQLALIFVMLLSAAVVTSQGLLRMLPWSLARTTHNINQSEPLADAFNASGVPHALFPDKIGHGIETPVADQFLDELNPDQSIPWKNWLAIAPVWGIFLLACWLLMVGVGLVLFPEWKHKERLQFPLLEVHRSLLPDSDSDHLFPSVFYSRLFWTGAGVVMALYALNGLNHHTHGAVPMIPLGWRLSHLFTEEPWRYLSGSIKNVNHIYFVLVGMAFFMPNRVSFSIWSITVGYCLFEMVHRAFFPPYYGGMIGDHRNGAMVAVSLMVLYISRHHLLNVGKIMISRVKSDSDRLLRVSGWMVVAGAVGMFIWLRWAGVPSALAAMFVFIGFLVSVLIARIVAETGMPFVRITGMNAWYFMGMFPASWVTGAAIYMSGFVSMVYQLGEKASPKYQLRLGYMMIIILVVGFFVCGAVHLYMGYTQAETLDGTYVALNSWGSNQMNRSENMLVQWSRDYWPMPKHRLNNLVFGFLLAGSLQIACMRSPRWPIHPIGMLLVGHFYGTSSWASIMFGWALKMSIVSLGGAAAYRYARPLFLGIIMGEIFSAIIWTVVPVVLLLMGHDPADVGHIPLLPR